MSTPNPTPAPNPVVWFEIYVDDMDRAKAFYNAMLGTAQWEKLTPEGDGTHPMDMWAFPMQMGAPGIGGSLVKMNDVKPGQGGTLVYFSSDDVTAAATRAEQAGGSIVLPKTSIGQYGYIALVQDTEGNTVGLHQMS